MPIKTNSEHTNEDFVVNVNYGRRLRRTKKYIDLQRLQVLGEPKVISYLEEISSNVKINESKFEFVQFLPI